MFKLTKILFWRGRIVGHFNGAREIDIAANFLKNRDIFRPFWSLKNRKNKEIISMKEKEKIQALRFETNWERWVYFCRKRWCNGPKSRLKRPIFRPKYFFFHFWIRAKSWDVPTASQLRRHMSKHADNHIRHSLMF